MASLERIRRRLQGAEYAGERFEGIDLRSASAYGSKWTSCTFKNCKFDLANLSGSWFTNCLFDGCSFEQASFAGTIFKASSVQDCRLSYVNMQGATVRGLYFKGCNLHGADLDFIEAESGSLAFDDCNLWSVKNAFGCTFWNGQFDEKNLKRFAGMLARRWPEGAERQALMGIAGKQFDVVSRLMDSTDEKELEELEQSA